jgi:endonuclease YncB( thermonuclease family)
MRVMAAEPDKQKPLERIDGCILVENRWNDGDTFRAKLPDGREESFRLYFVDAPELKTRLLDRNDDARAYFEIDADALANLAKEAANLTKEQLAAPFTIYTRWRPVFGSNRYYGFVITADGADLSALLVSRGVAAIRGPRNKAPDGRRPDAYLASLNELEKQAKEQALGGWKR